MSKRYQRALLLCAKKYSLFNSCIELLAELAQETRGIDIRSRISAADLRINAQIYRLPFKIKNRWETYFLKKANKILIAEIQNFDPDLILVYNSEYLLPETCAEIKKKAELVFFMGDSPFYTPLNNYYLTCLIYADLILSPDSFWIEQLNTMGLRQTVFYVPGIDETSYFMLNGPDRLKELDERDVLYAGSCYVNSWGYKKALLMSQFTRFNFRLYGNAMWKRWFRFFPELEGKYVEAEFIPAQKLNRMLNSSKMTPVDGNPGILNGFHLRLLEALGAGTLPLVEYRKDVEKLLFKGCRAILPLIKDYSKAGDLVEYFLKNESERQGLVKELKDYVLSHYNAKANSEMLLEALNRIP